MSDDLRRRMTVSEFRDLGYLQEVNRLLLHPLGLALEATVDDDGTEAIVGVWDCRDDPEGIYFGEGTIDTEKARRVAAEGDARKRPRTARLGYFVQSRA